MPNIIDQILNSGLTAEEKISALQNKNISTPAWSDLRAEYDPRLHPVMDKAHYPDIVTDNTIQHVTRITCNLQQLAVRRMSELVTGIPVKRVYNATTDGQQEVARSIEAILQRARIDSVNVERTNLLFASCEVMTLWYATPEATTAYGFLSPMKLRCRNFSPMLGDSLYPLFDEYGDMQAMSVAYSRRTGRDTVRFFDTYTSDRHIKWSQEGGTWHEVENEPITLSKIPAIYAHRPTPVWEDTSKTVYEIEWALSRNGNYLRQNSKPLFVVFADEAIQYGDERDPDREFRSVMQYPKGSTAQYITWGQAVENLKFYVEQLRSLFFTQLQLPDWSYERMSQQALSGESRKQMFIDAQLKVKDESGRLLEFFDREVNVIKAFLKVLRPNLRADIDALGVETVITPFSINDEADTIKNLITANGGEPIISQRESIEMYGRSKDVSQTLDEINAQKMGDVFNPEPTA